MQQEAAEDLRSAFMFALGLLLAWKDRQTHPSQDIQFFLFTFVSPYYPRSIVVLPVPDQLISVQSRRLKKFDKRAQ